MTPAASGARPRMPLSVAAALLFIAVLVAVALLADVLAPRHYAQQAPLDRLLPPIFAGGGPPYLLGTDYLGRDVLSRLIYAIRMSILVALLGTLIGAVLGSILGVVAGHFGGWVDDLIMGAVDVQASLPFLIFALMVLAFFGSSIVLFILLVGFAGWERYARLVRGLVLAARAESYAGAVTALGGRPLRIYRRHILPNIAAPLFVQLTLNFPETILLETGLSFLGLGIQPPLTSLGLMISEGRDYIALAWWIAVLPGATIFLTTLSISLLGDWLRDRLDPSLQ
jgi:peptide/nickel transport system permease protein